MVWYGMVRHVMAWYGMVWYAGSCCVPPLKIIADHLLNKTNNVSLLTRGECVCVGGGVLRHTLVHMKRTTAAAAEKAPSGDTAVIGFPPGFA